MEILIIGCVFNITIASIITYLVYDLFGKSQMKYLIIIAALILTGYYVYEMLIYKTNIFIQLFYMILIIISLSGFISSAIMVIYLDYNKVYEK